MKPRIIAIAGPTASGKTDLSIQIAQQLKTEIISFDSRQFYRELNIGVARPSPDQLSAVTHHFIANRSILEPYSAASFGAEARKSINNILNSNDFVVLCGGTGLYLKAVLEGFSPLPQTPPEIRQQVNSLWTNEGVPGLIRLINSKDPEALLKVEKQNPARLKRAAELLLNSEDRTLSELYATKTDPIEHSYMIFNLNPDKAALYERIEQRVDNMLSSGLIEEVKSLTEYNTLPVLKTVGYSELFDFFDGKCSMDEAVLKIKQHTRNYAKRQLTWFKNQTHGTFLQPERAAISILNAI